MLSIETAGVIGPQSMAFLKELGRRLRQVSGDERPSLYMYLVRRLSVAVQRGNAAFVVGTIEPTMDSENFFKIE